MAGLGITRLLGALVASAIALAIGIIGVVERRTQICEPLDALPGVDCPDLSEPATTAAIVAAAACLVVALAATVVARTARGPWIGAVAADGQPRSLPVLWGLGTFVSWFALLSGLLVFAVLTAVVHDRSGLGSADISFPLVVTGVVLAGAALSWTSWRARRVRAIANRRAGGPVFSFATGASGGSSRGAWGAGWGGPASAPDHGTGAGSAGAGSAGAGWQGSGGWDDGGSGAGSGGAWDSGGGYPRDGGVYGDGPQHGTRSLADQQGGFYDDDHRDLRPPAEQPGNFYSSDPFGREPD